MKLNKLQIDDILLMVQEYSDAHASVVAKMFDEYGDMDDEEDLLQDENLSYKILVDYLKEIK